MDDNVQQNTPNPARTRKYDEQEQGEMRLKKKVKSLSDLVLPISVGALVLLIAILVFVPMIKGAINSNNQYKTVHAQVENLQKLESQVKSLDEDQTLEDLLNAKSVIPTSLKATSFLYYVGTSANLNNLQYTSIGVNDATAKVNSVSTSINMTGRQEDILAFLKGFYDTSPYIVSINGVSLRGQDDTWNITFNLIGYYISGTQTADISLSSPFTKYTNYSDVVEVFSTKAEQLAKDNQKITLD